MELRPGFLPSHEFAFGRAMADCEPPTCSKAEAKSPDEGKAHCSSRRHLEREGPPEPGQASVLPS